MKILLLDWALPKLLKDSDSISGGAASEWYSWIKGITANGHEFVLLTFKGANEYIPFGPFIVASTLIAIFIPADILQNIVWKIFTLGLAK